MKTVVAAAVVATGVVVSALALTSNTFAQSRDSRPRPARVDVLGWPGSALGVSVRDLTANEAAKAKLLSGTGVMIEAVRESSPAERAGLREGDIVVEFDGERIRSAQQFARIVRETPGSRVVKTTLVRGSARQTVDVTPLAGADAPFDRLGDLSREIERSVRRLPRDFEFDFDFPVGASVMVSPRRLGATLTPLNEQLATYFGVKSGVLVSSVDERSAAAEAGLKAGDVITSIDGRQVNDVSDASETIRRASPGASLGIQVTRDKKELSLKATMPRPQRPVARGGFPI